MLPEGHSFISLLPDMYYCLDIYSSEECIIMLRKKSLHKEWTKLSGGKKANLISNKSAI